MNSSRNNNLTGDLTYVKTINGLQSNPETWLRLLNELKKLPEGDEKKKILKYYYVKVKKVIDIEQHKNNESFAKILINDALYLGQTSVSDARDEFKQVSNKLRRVPLIHIAFAQFEIDQGRSNKALKALQFGLTFSPTDPSLIAAIAKLNNGETNIISCCTQAPPPLRTITNSGCSNSWKNHQDYKHTGATTSRIHPVIKTPKVHHHTMAEALDLPPSPCSPDLNNKVKPGLKTPKQTRKQYNFTINVSTPKTPILTSYSSTRHTKSISCQLSREAGNLHQSSTKINKEATSSNHDFGKPLRILRSKQRSDHESEDEDDFYVMKKKRQRLLSASKLMESPQFKEAVRPTHEEEPNHMPPPSSVPQRVPHQQSSEKELQDWLHKTKVLNIHEKSYLLIKELGVGGSSKVYEVLDMTSKSIKAVKQVNLSGCDDDSVRAGFVNEIKFLQRLKGNQNIIQLYDFELTDHCLYMVMECGSTDLAKLMNKHKANKVKLEPYKIWYFWKEMLTSVKTIHDQGVIHMDLKPANFLFVKGNLKLIDFGISNSIQADATSIIKESQCGTLNYMAPEAIMDMSGGHHATASKLKISPRADVWSLGCILYLMMYGRTPFQHITHQMMKLHAISNPACRIDFDGFPDQKLLQIVQNCLQRDPKLRPTVEQLLLT